MAVTVKSNFLRMEVDESIALQCPGCNLRDGYNAHQLRETRIIFQLPAEAATIKDVKQAIEKTFNLSVGIDILFEDRLFLPSVSVKAVLALLAGSGGFVRIRPHNQSDTSLSILSSGSLGTSSGYEANDEAGSNLTAAPGMHYRIFQQRQLIQTKCLTVSENDQSHIQSHANSSLDTIVESSVGTRKITGTPSELSGAADSLPLKDYDCYDDDSAMCPVCDRPLSEESCTMTD